MNTNGGDSVYVECEACALILSTDIGYIDDPRNRIVLEPNIYANLLGFVLATEMEITDR